MQFNPLTIVEYNEQLSDLTTLLLDLGATHAQITRAKQTPTFADGTPVTEENRCTEEFIELVGMSCNITISDLL